ncbi:TonB-dependent receptor [Asticcacaulis excentricus]|uniref:TonB-dependent receptor n=1 Tax=Asticcacaulis excentricus (strain ATCC 15261 / DSM 4724 / KCTC 12464 / NCIMB 9791 / VKM B-1370 / CB 48) TaxID=573065 RepID=E8RMD7_ASTEC|nr:TonB-dependent receptor [Asticcacaulis excentricus]ADU13888.1 TonB-dependent receptor [Asticcacaulis excentricus CB 48]
MHSLTCRSPARTTCFLLGFTALVSFAWIGAANAQSAPVRTYSIPAQSTQQALKALAEQSGRQILFPFDAAKDARSPALVGDYTLSDALLKLTEGTKLDVAEITDTAIYLKARQSKEGQAKAVEAAPQDVVVIGSRIRGARPSAPVIRQTEEEIQMGGFSNVGDALMSLPQAHGGGQNPGVGVSQGSYLNANTNSGSKANLRGIGADATLTLLNGHRLADDSATAGADLSTIPLAAIDRFEVIADGASALYGSDAVGGVVNVVLKRRFSGLRLDARVGGATQGGLGQQQLSLVTGLDGERGGVMIGIDATEIDPIVASQRAYTYAMDGVNTLYPQISKRNVIIAGQYALTPDLDLRFDGLVSRRNSTSIASPVKGEGYQRNGNIAMPETTAHSLFAALDYRLGHGWQVTGQVQSGKDDSQLYGLLYSNGVGAVSALCYCNAMRASEVFAEGPLFRLPGGPVRLAIGAGTRENRMAYTRTLSGNSVGRFDVTRTNDYQFAELSLPLVSKDNSVSFVDRLILTLATRHEAFSDLEDVSVPKVGLVYAPNDTLTFKGSWGKSFKAPDFLQRYNVQQTILRNVSGYGTTFPTGATYLSMSGGNTTLKPERATTKTFTLEYTPKAVDGLTVSLSYFDIDYTDRISVLLTSYTGVLTNPVYTTLVTFNPSQAQINAAIAGAAVGLQVSGSPSRDLTRVIALVDNRWQNASALRLNGYDLAVDHRFTSAAGSEYVLSVSASHLKSRQQLSPTQAYYALSGTVFDPAQLRVRAGLGWRHGGASVQTYVNYMQGLTDDRRQPWVDVPAYTTVDVSGRLQLGEQTHLSLSVQNLFNQEPPLIFTSYGTETPFDTTNHSAIGRYVSLTLSRSF